MLLAQPRQRDLSRIAPFCPNLNWHLEKIVLVDINRKYITLISDVIVVYKLNFYNYFNFSAYADGGDVNRLRKSILQYFINNCNKNNKIR